VKSRKERSRNQALLKLFIWIFLAAFIFSIGGAAVVTSTQGR